MIFLGGPFILKLTPKTPSPTWLPTKIFPTKGIQPITLLTVLAGIKVPLKLTIFPLSTYPSNKIGEGVFGVSFKMKGPPKNIKTTVNPIKTLTPRFITRMLEKMKDIKNKREETK